MAIKPLSTAEVTRLGAASSAAVERATGRVRRYTDSGRWLPISNRYRRDTTERLDADDTAGTVRPRQLSDYIAASAPLHCVDGWEYLGRALGAHLAGRPSLARHLAYYAELRASMSLLATDGVGIFNNRHFVVEANGRATRAVKRRGTHQVAWLALESWSNRPDAPQKLSRIVAPFRVEMAEWIASFPGGGSWKAQGQDWLRTWGLDLRMFEFDQAARNASSYRPTGLEPASALDPDVTARFAEEFWMLLEPQTLSPFETLDRYLLRRCIEAAFLSATSLTPRRARRRFRDGVTTMVAAHLAPGVLADELVTFICRDTFSVDPMPLLLAEATDTATAPTHHLQVISRALLLLRIASGASQLMLGSSNLDFQNLAFWWGELGIERGLWAAPPAASEIIDSWLDIEAAIDDLRSWRSRPGTKTLRGLTTTDPIAVRDMCHAEVVPLWTFAA